MDYSAICSTLQSQFPDLEIYLNHPLAPYTTLKIGGPADLFIHPSTHDQFISIINLVYKYHSLSEITVDEVKEANGAQSSESGLHRTKGVSTGNSFTSQLNFPVTILGSGSNVLISDSGIRGIVVKNDSSDIDFTKSPLVNVSSGTLLSYLITQTLDHGLLGLEEFAYIPGTIGGAVFGNIHGVTRRHFSDFLQSVTCFDPQTGQIINTLRSNPTLIILSATLRLTPGDPAAARQFIKDTISQKSLTQPMNSAGCVFKNPPIEVSTNQKIIIKAQKAGLPAKALATAGKIIDTLGWKGKSIGGAQVSPLHANFIVNANNATASEFFTLMTQIQADVLTKTGINLIPEIKLLGEF